MLCYWHGRTHPGRQKSSLSCGGVYPVAPDVLSATAAASPCHYWRWTASTGTKEKRGERRYCPSRMDARIADRGAGHHADILGICPVLDRGRHPGDNP